jgi:regulator of protease activity HflC (stomatin/prohibitin superfamily)
VQVIIPNGYAAVTERNARFLRVLPPGYHVLGRFEYLLGVVDLQPQSRHNDNVSMLTREGIPVKGEIGLTFSIDPGDEPSELRPYPFRPEAVRRAAYAGSMGAGGKGSNWADAPLGKAVGALSSWVSSHTLDELLAADASHDAHHLMTQAIVDKVWDKDGLLKDGIKPLRLHVGRLTPPEEVSQQYTEVWLATQQKDDQLSRADGKAQLTHELETVRAEGQLLLIQALVEGMRRAQQQAGSSISGYVLAMSLVEALRQMFNMSARKVQPVDEDSARLEDEISAVTERLAELEDSLRLPSVFFNQGKSE